MIKRLNTCEEVAAMAVLLASEAGGGITGRSVERRRRLVVMVTALLSVVALPLERAKCE